jgi:predicted metalloendopeptidase
MDRTTPPSVDFYQYATGGWMRSHPVPSDKPGWNAFAELTDRNYQLIRGILEDCRAGTTEGAGVRRLVGDFYASAMDTARIEELRFAPIEPDLAEIRDLRSVDDLLRLVGRFHRGGLGGLFRADVAPDERDSAVYALYLNQGGLSLPDRDYYLKDGFSAQAEAFRGHITRMFGLLGDGTTEAREAAATIFSLEHRLAMASRPRAELREAEKNYHKLSTSELVERYGHTPWTTYLAEVEMPQIPYAVVGQPEFFDALDRALLEVPLSDWKLYARWRLLVGSARFLHEEVEREQFDFYYRTLMGQQQPEPRWQRSARVLDAAIGEAVGELYVERHFPPEARRRMSELVEDLREVFRDRLSKLEWMTEETRHRAVAKFDRFTAKIGHPDRFRDYSAIGVDRKDYFGNRRRAAEFEHHRQAVRVGGPVDRTEWGMTPPQVNAYFDPTKNEIVFPAGILQPPFFDLAMDDAVNFGGIGAVIAHEITHGYDDQGRKYGADGNLSEWWTEADAREFGARAAKVVEEYSGYEPLPGSHVNGQLTLGENIADLGGLSLAFAALERRLAADPARRTVIDGLTPEQRFFISWAQVWRENNREDNVRLRLTVDPHSPGRFRALGPAMNHPGFAAAFGIPAGSPMWRPGERRIRIW